MPIIGTAIRLLRFLQQRYPASLPRLRVMQDAADPRPVPTPA